MKYPLLVGWLLGVGTTFFMAIAWALVISFYHQLRKLLDDQ